MSWLPQKSQIFVGSTTCASACGAGSGSNTKPNSNKGDATDAVRPAVASQYEDWPIAYNQFTAGGCNRGRMKQNIGDASANVDIAKAK